MNKLYETEYLEYLIIKENIRSINTDVKTIIIYNKFFDILECI